MHEKRAPLGLRGALRQVVLFVFIISVTIIIIIIARVRLRVGDLIDEMI
jgi:hypothetical protein